MYVVGFKLIGIDVIDGIGEEGRLMKSHEGGRKEIWEAGRVNYCR